jgi:sulfatase maturation enzyme AslB (radical SAM superfamily)
MNNTPPSNIFCSLPFTSMDIDTTGMVRACCKYMPKKVEKLDTYFMGDDLVETKTNFLQGRWPTQCIACKRDEEVSGHSFRILNTKFESSESQIRLHNSPHYSDIKKVNILTSNVCNLKCLMCYRSSFIRNAELYKLKLIPNIPVLTEMSDDDIKIVSDLTGIQKYTFLGGEPFADKPTRALIDQLIKNGKSKNIIVEFNTNLTLIDFDTLQRLKTNFKEVVIKASLDGIGDVNDYIRYPANWSDILRAIDIMKELDLNFMVTTALSNLSLLRYYDLIGWLQELNIQDVFISAVSHPMELSCEMIPLAIKQKLLPKYIELRNKNFSERMNHVLDACITLCESTVEIDFSKTIGYLKKHDELRGNDLYKVFPELIGYG